MRILQHLLSTFEGYLAMKLVTSTRTVCLLQLRYCINSSCKPLKYSSLLNESIENVTRHFIDDP